MAQRKRKLGRGGTSTLAETPGTSAETPTLSAEAPPSEGLAARARHPATVAPGGVPASDAAAAFSSFNASARETSPQREAPPRSSPAPSRQKRAKPKPVTHAEWMAHYAQRAEERNAAARAELIPLAPGERPWPIRIAVAVCGLAALANLILYLAGAKVGHKPPSTAELVVFVAVTGACAIGMWALWYQAVLGFMVLLGIVIIYFALFLVEASNLLGVVYPLVIIFGGGWLFWKLIRVLARLQMPERRSRRA